MTNEIQQTQETCICKSKGFKNFVCIALGTFVGAFCALNLFAALNKPPIFMPMPHHFQHQHHMMDKQLYQHNHHKDCPCHKEMKAQDKKLEKENK